jgi:SAM-dependent methyltransferase
MASQSFVSTLRSLASRMTGKPDLQTRIFSEFLRALRMNQSGFPDRLVLPDLYGKGLPERTVEILMAHLTYAPAKRVLDVGYANTMECHRAMVAALTAPRHLTGIDIAEPVYDASRYYESMSRADITRSPFADASFDLIWCVSALEHFGMDNSVYTEQFSAAPAMDAQAVKEMLRLLVPGGQLLITVPYGRFEDHTTHKNYDRDHWQPLLDIARVEGYVREWYFRHTHGHGWQQAPAEELQYVGYFDQANAGAGGVAATLITKT